MRITEIMLSSNFGGLERHFLDCALECARHGHEVQVICRQGFTHRQAFDGQAHLMVQPLPLFGTWDPLARHRLTSILRNFHPDVVHTHGRRAAWMGGKAARHEHLRCMAVLHNEGTLDRYCHVDSLIATSEGQRQHALQQGWPAERIAISPCFSRMPAVEVLPQRAAGPLRLLAYGRFDPVKGFDLLLEAFRLVLDQGVDAILRLGGAGPEHTRLLAKTRQLNLGDRVLFTGWIDDVQAALDSADLFVLPSRSESFGIVILEAMARGIPIVSTRTHGPRQILDESTAYLVETGSVESLATGLLAAARDAARSRSMAQCALDRFRQQYAAEAVLPTLLRALADEKP